MEITTELSLTPDEESIIDMHSVINVVNIIMIEISRLGMILDAERAMEPFEDRLYDLARSIPEDSVQRALGSLVRDFITDLEAVLVTIAGTAAEGDREEVAGILSNLESIFGILRVRADEIEARAEDPDAWVEHSIEHLSRNFHDVLRAIEQNSKGKYRIVYNCAEHSDHTYLVNFAITSVEGPKIRMPAVFQDVMRDLIANARKYTPPGGTITTGLHNDGEELRFVVCDTGCGIPENEIERIIAFGERGSNVSDYPTRGGGFGLTKAYYKTRRLNGRMWIDSNAGAASGTRIEIRLPVPGE